MTEQNEAWQQHTQIITRDDGSEYSITSWVKNTVPAVRVHQAWVDVATVNDWKSYDYYNWAG